MAHAGLVIVSNRLPVNIEIQNGQITSHRSIGGVATALGTVADRYHAKWVGWTGLAGRMPTDQLRLALGNDLVPVQAGVRLFKGYYDHFSNCVLWPALHNIPPTITGSEADWRAYCRMNQRFAQTTVATAKPRDLIWMHDYHLLMVPHFIRETGAANRLGFFLHVPIPPVEAAGSIPHLDDLLDSLVQLDLLGVQTQRDADNLQELLKATGRARFCRTQIFPIGIDYRLYNQSNQLPGVQQLARAYHQSVQNRRVIFSLSRLDYTKGLLTQLQAVEAFMAATPNREQFVYKLVVAPSREQVKGYRQLHNQIEQTVAAINNRLGNSHWQPIDHTYENLGFKEVVAWYQLAETLLLLPSMDGMNLIAKEYPASRTAAHGNVVLSTGTGASHQLSDALLITPGNPGAAALALHQAASMPLAEQAKRMRQMREIIKSQDVTWWAEQFVSALQG